VTRDAFGFGIDTSCPNCGDPNGAPCTSCGYRLRNRDRVQESRVTPSREYRPLTDAERAYLDQQDRAAMERAELRESYL